MQSGQISWLCAMLYVCVPSHEHVRLHIGPITIMMPMDRNYNLAFGTSLNERGRAGVATGRRAWLQGQPKDEQDYEKSAKLANLPEHFFTVDVVVGAAFRLTLSASNSTLSHCIHSITLLWLCQKV